MGQAIKVRREVAQDPDDYWNRLLCKLLGNAVGGGALKQFHGHCGLRNWLGTVAKRLAWKVVKPKPPQPPLEHGGEQPSNWTPEDELRLSAAVARIPQWLASLDASDRALVQMCLLDRLPQKDAAAVLKRHPGNVARRLKDLQRDYLDSLDC